MVRVGLIGCGAIGTMLAEAIDDGTVANAELTAVFDTYPERMKELVKRLRRRPKEYREFERFLRESGAEIIVEAASQEAVKLYAEKVIASGMDILIMSVGALLDEELLKKIKTAAESEGRRVLIPSGAIGGLDAVKAARLGGLDRVVLTTRKHPDSLKDSPHFQRVVKDPDGLKDVRVVFEGAASEAVKAFPVNVNVSAALSLAGVGGANTVVRVVADPSVTKNIHEIEVEGRFGRMKVLLENIRHPSNPKTSYLAVLSAIETLRSMASREIQIGT
ncbi:MAG: aspartate dehydrogenase [Nitrososphaerales archaeon]